MPWFSSKPDIELDSIAVPIGLFDHKASALFGGLLPSRIIRRSGGVDPTRRGAGASKPVEE